MPIRVKFTGKAFIKTGTLLEGGCMHAFIAGDMLLKGHFRHAYIEEDMPKKVASP